MEGIARKPAWLRIRPPPEGYHRTRDILRAHNLDTVCASARCPNVGECWGAGEATFLVLGRVCTRGCRFCAVEKGVPEAPDPTEPERLAECVAELALSYVVITSVTRDDLSDGGAGHIAECVRAVKKTGAEVEVLVPDFQGDERSIAAVLEARPEIYNHNTETVPRLYKRARPGGRYERVMSIFRLARQLAPDIPTKSGIMLGLGETIEEVVAVMHDLREVDVDILTLGQYLRPSNDHLPLDRYYTPDEFHALRVEGLAMGYRHVESGPLVRSSYHAWEQVQAAREMGEGRWEKGEGDKTGAWRGTEEGQEEARTA